MAGEEYRDYLILDGVGGSSVAKDGRNPVAGSFDWADRDKGAKRGDRSVEMGGRNTRLGGGVATRSGERGFRYGRESMPLGGAVGANAIGYGVEDNARHAIVTIANLPQLPDTINLIGWSRGAVTALVIANMLYDPSSTEGLFRPAGGAATGLTGRKIATSSAMGQEIAGAAAMGQHVLASLALLGVAADGAIIALPAPGSGMDGRHAAFRQTGDLVQMGVVS